MQDELLYDQATVHTICLQLENGSADILAAPDGDDMRILIDTDAEDAAAFLFADVKDGTLLIRQRTPVQQLLKTRKRPSLHITIEAPAAWKGALHASTVSGQLRAEDVSGTDITLKTGSGMLEARRISGICVRLQSRRGGVSAEDVACEKLHLSSVTADVQAQRCSFGQCWVTSLTGAVQADETGRMERIRCRSLTGGLTVETSLPAVDAVMHSVKGRLRTLAVDLADGQPVISMTTLSGRLTIIRREGE